MIPETFPVPVGLVGLGALSQRSLLPHFSQPDAKDRLDLVAVCEKDETRARLSAEKFGVSRYYYDLEVMLREAPIEAVLIATPIHLHYAHAMAALRANKHVYIQKPAATTLSETQEIFGEAKQRGRVALASPVQMLNPARKLAQKLINEGRIGPVYWAICTTNAPGHENERARLGEEPLSRIDPTWYFKASGGPVLDMTIYALDTLVGLLGPVRRVTAFSGLRVPIRQWMGQEIMVEADDNSLLILDFGDSMYGLVSGSNAHPGKRIGWGEVTVFGGKGTLEIYSDNPAEPNLANVVALVGDKAHRINDFGPYLPPSHAALPDPHVYADIMHFVDYITEQAQPLADGDRSSHLVEIIEKGYQAARTGQTQKLTTTF